MLQNAGSTGTRIDGILCNAVLRQTLRNFSVLRDTGLPTHLPVVATFATSAFGQSVWQVVRPLAFPVADWEEWAEDDEDDTALEALLSTQAEWEAAWASRDVGRLWTAWCVLKGARFSECPLLGLFEATYDAEDI